MEVDSNIGKQCVQWLELPLMLTNDYYSTYVSEASRNYIAGPVGKARFKKLPKILNGLHAMSKDYKDFASYLENEAKKQGCSPYSLHDLSEGPPVKW